MGKYVLKVVKTGVKFVLKADNGQVILDSEVYSGEAAALNGIESVRKNCLGEIEDQTVENFEEKGHPKFELYLDKTGEYRFRLKAKNGQIVGASEGYKSWDNCMNGIKSVKENAPEAEVFRQMAGGTEEKI